MDSTDIRLRGIIGVAVAAILIAVGCYSFTFYDFGWSHATAVWGTFGDYLGGVLGTIFNLLGVILIYLTFKSQTEFSRLQLENATLQQFESTFFNLLANQRDIVRGMSIKVREVDREKMKSVLVSKKGDDCIRVVAEQLEKAMAPISLQSGPKLVEKAVYDAYATVYKGKEQVLDHYFRHLYHIIKYVDGAGVGNPRKYVDIVEAQMSDNELFLAFGNGLGEYGKRNFFPLMETYQFVENVRNRQGEFEAYKRIVYPKTFPNKKTGASD